jgi:hypothetical protein
MCKHTFIPERSNAVRIKCGEWTIISFAFYRP